MEIWAGIFLLPCVHKDTSHKQSGQSSLLAMEACAFHYYTDHFPERERGRMRESYTLGAWPAHKVSTYMADITGNALPNSRL